MEEMRLYFFLNHRSYDARHKVTVDYSYEVTYGLAIGTVGSDFGITFTAYVSISWFLWAPKNG